MHDCSVVVVCTGCLTEFDLLIAGVLVSLPGLAPGLVSLVSCMGGDMSVIPVMLPSLVLSISGLNILVWSALSIMELLIG